MDDADTLRRALCNAAHARKADRVVAAQHQRQCAGREHVRHAARNLVEALFQIAGNREHVAGVAQRHLFAQIDAELVVVGRVERRDAADALRPEARAGPVGRAGIERNADHRGVVFGDIAHVLDIRRLQERVDAGEMRQLAARESRDRLVGQAVGAGQPHVERPLLFLAPSGLGQFAFGVERLPALRGHAVEIGMMAVHAFAHGKQPGLARYAREWIPHQDAPCVSCLSVDDRQPLLRS